MNPYKDLQPLSNNSLGAFIRAVNSHYGTDYPLGAHPLYSDIVTEAMISFFPVHESSQYYIMLFEYHRYWMTRLNYLTNQFFDLQEVQSHYQFTLGFTPGDFIVPGLSPAENIVFEGFGTSASRQSLDYLIQFLSSMFSWHKYQYSILEPFVDGLYPKKSPQKDWNGVDGL